MFTLPTTAQRFITLIGLLNLINCSEAQEHCQRERGQDAHPPKYGDATITPHGAYDRPRTWSDLYSGATRLVLVRRIRSMAGLGLEGSQGAPTVGLGRHEWCDSEHEFRTRLISVVYSTYMSMKCRCTEAHTPHHVETSDSTWHSRNFKGRGGVRNGSKTRDTVFLRDK
ncbi:hypothetical protein EI94DRAFT_44985 [Lactarius quietus]|nr:hypothetical protein EI94DRAFT_44985 [Lactarius quietus]